MTAHSTLDPDSFQRLLSNAFAVQENGMDAESLTAIVELQRAIATGEADVNRAMDVIAVCTRDVANATGIAIGLLKGDQLVYRAGSGSGVTFVGQRVMATLCVSAHNAATGEILRVENVQTDKRIEAAICRQFGVHALLIVPIYHDGMMAGVLNVLFDEAHAFQHREVLIYRLMATLVGEAMSYAARPEQKTVLAADLSPLRQSIWPTGPQRAGPLTNSASSPAVAPTNRTIYQACATLVARAGKLPALPGSAWAALSQAKRVQWYKGRWETAVGVAVVLVIACWIGFRDRRPASHSGVSGPQESNALEPQRPFPPAKRVLANSTSKAQAALGREPSEWKTDRALPQRALDRNVRVRYISDDVTVRYFTPKPPPQQVLGKNIRVRHVSEDVTVRYFTPEPLVSPSSLPSGSAAQPVNR